MIDDPNASPRGGQHLCQTPAGMFRPDNQPPRDIGQPPHRSAAIRFKKSLETRDHVRIIAKDHKVARALETFPREIQRSNQGAAVVGDNVLGVVLHHRALIWPDVCAKALEQRGEVFEPVPPTSRSLRNEYPDVDAASHRRGDLINNLEVIAPEHR